MSASHRASGTDEQAAVAAPTTGRRFELDVLRILAILGVVAIHVFGLILGRPDLRGTPTWTFAVVLDLGARWSVPFFVLASGLLVLAPRAHAAGPAAFYRKRVTRLLPALVVWHAVYLLVVRFWMQGEEPRTDFVIVNFIDGKVFTALYFLWLILGLYAVAPVLAAFLSAGGQRRAATAAAVALVWCGTVTALPAITSLLGEPRPWSQGALTWWLAFAGLFLAGYAWGTARPESTRWRWTAPLGLLLMAEAVWQFSVTPDHRWLQAALPPTYTGLGVAVGSVCLFVAGVDLLARLRPSDAVRRVTGALSDATFGVFLVHLLVVAVLRQVWPEWYASPAPVDKTEMYVVVVVAAFAISMLARQVPVLRRVF
ncbi:acyltransferase family protein [Nocardioides lijunqiniae]|uniref:acyltransferase family protein n=1 Tax=Nocardioides lijunqiniae TaxID=2760832 RepID=UPI001877C0B4